MLPLDRFASPAPLRVMASWSSGSTSSPASASPSLRTFSRSSTCASRVLNLSCALSPSPMRSVTTLKAYPCWMRNCCRFVEKYISSVSVETSE